MGPIRSNITNGGWQARPNGLISAEAKKLLYQIFVTPRMTHNVIACFHKYDWLCHLATFFRPINYNYKRWPSDKANHTCENMVCHSRSYKYLIK